MTPARRPRLSFATRLTLALGLLLLAYGAFVAVLARQLAAEHEQESMQRLSHVLARHIVGHWPQIAASDRDAAERAARAALLGMLMTVNPAVQVYGLDADGRVADYIGEPGMVRQPQVDLAPVRAFLTGAVLPLRGTDPMGSNSPRIFSAAMFPQQPGESRPPGYLYVVLDGQPRDQAAAQQGLDRVWRGAAIAAALGLLATVLVGVLTFSRLTRPLHRLAGRLRDYNLREQGTVGTLGSVSTVGAIDAAKNSAGHEVQAIAAAFDGMTQRLEVQAAREQAQAQAHRETIASVAHDLRTPLTALHGQLEALAGDLAAQPARHDRQPRMLAAALAQSDKVRRLSQQLFELAALQSTEQVLRRESFRLDELVTDTVQKFELTDRVPLVRLSGVPPGRVELDGDLELIERALSNLIDNALQHAPGADPVRVSLQREGALARIVVEDSGPGLPAELLQRLEAGQSVRETSLRRASGGIGGLGLAIAQRVAQLHGGRLLPLPAPQGGTRLCLLLPLVG